MTTALIEALHHRANSRPESVAFVSGQDVWTYQRLKTEAERLARGLTKRGLREGNRVALHITNAAELVVAYYACFRIGVGYRGAPEYQIEIGGTAAPVGAVAACPLYRPGGTLPTRRTDRCLDHSIHWPLHYR